MRSAELRVSFSSVPNLLVHVFCRPEVSQGTYTELMLAELLFGEPHEASSPNVGRALMLVFEGIKGPASKCIDLPPCFRVVGRF